MYYYYFINIFLKTETDIENLTKRRYNIVFLIMYFLLFFSYVLIFIWCFKLKKVLKKILISNGKKKNTFSWLKYSKLNYNFKHSLICIEILKSVINFFLYLYSEKLFFNLKYSQFWYFSFMMLYWSLIIYLDS